MTRFCIRAVATGVKFDLLGANGEAVATSEVYRSPAACRKGIASVRLAAPAAGLWTTESPDVVPHPRFELYRDRAGAYRFRLKARNGAVIAVSQGYTTAAACRAGIESVRQSAPDAVIEMA